MTMTLSYGLWKMFNYSPKKGAILESVQQIYGKRPLKILKAAVTRWLTHGRASQRILDCFKELLETLDQICLDTNEAEVRGFRSMLTQHRITFCICFLTDILVIMNVLSLVLQKEGILMVDIKHTVEAALDQLRQLAKSFEPREFSAVLSPRKSYYSGYQGFLDILNDFSKTRKHIRSFENDMTINSFHSRIAIPLITTLIKEIEQAFETTSFPTLDAFHAFHPRNIPADALSDYGQHEAKLLYGFYGNNKIDTFKGDRNEGAAIIKCGEEIFLSQCRNYFELIARKNGKMVTW